MRERSVEGYLYDRVIDLGGFCLKLNPLWYTGIPDRLVLLPGGRVIFIELKRPIGGRKGRRQNWWRDQLAALGFTHHFCKTFEEVDAALA